MPTGSRSRIGRPSLVSRAASPLRAARGGSAGAGGAGAGRGRHRRHERLGAEIVRGRPGRLAGRLLQPVAQFARELLKCAVFAGAQRRRLFHRWRGRGRAERQHLAGLFGRLRQLGASALDRRHALDVAADAEAAEAGELALAVEHRQARHLDRQPLGFAIDRPIHHDAAPGVARGKCRCDLTLRIELERGRDLGPGAVEHDAGLRTEQAGEIFGAEREARCRVHLPDEAQRKAARASVDPGGVGGGEGDRGRFGARGAGRRGESHQQRDRALAGAELEHGDAAGRDVAFGAAIEHGLARQRGGAERGQVGGLAEALARLSGCFDQFAVGGEHGRRAIEIGEQPPRAFRQRKLPAGALGRDDQHGCGIIGEREARAQAGQRAAEARAEAAQAFEPRGAAGRQRAGQPHDLRGGRMLAIEMESGGGGRRCGLEDFGADRIGPQDARRVRAP